MSEEDMRIECLRLQSPASGLDKSAIQRQLLGHIVARATSTPARQNTAPPVYAAGTADQLGPDLQGLDLVDLNLEELDHREQDLGDRTKIFRRPCTPHHAMEIPFGILGMYMMRPLPTRVLVSLGSGRIVRPIETQPPAPSRTMPQFSDVSTPSCSSVA